MAHDAPTLYPLMRYRDAPAAIAFLKDAFGFQERQVIANEDGTIAHAELELGPGILMLGSEREDQTIGSRAGRGWIYVAIDDADAHHDRALAAGAEVVSELHDTDYGSRDYAARDLEGNMWHFGTYRPAVEPAPEATTATGGQVPELG
jgi:uncharacterized glyoxalase superfamily protein PhnB